VNLEKIEKIMEKGYDLNVIALLYMCKHGESVNSPLEKIRAVVAMMERKGLILEGKITASGEELLKYAEGEGEIIREKEKTENLEGLYERVVKRVEELTGKRQVRTEIYGKTYSYLPSKYDFISRLKKVVNKYSLTDVPKLEKVIIHNIEKCNKTKKWYPLLVYYFIKDDISPLAAEYENWKEEEKAIEQDYDGTNI
jgi:hypothetical protein